MIQKSLNQLEKARKEIRWQMAVFGVSGGSAAISSQFLNKHHKTYKTL